MLSNMNFYSFMHKQILVLIALFATTGTSYIYIGYLYTELFLSSLWYGLIILVSIWGFRLYYYYSNNDLNLEDKEIWLSKVRYFLFTYFSLWTIIFLVFVSGDNIELHYVALGTQFGVAVVSATILVSQRKLVTFTLISSMLPITVYFILVGEFYSYLLSLLTIVLGAVLLYASKNTYNYLVKSQYQAYHDYLTSLGNRRYFIELLDDAVKIQKQDRRPIYLLLIDLDHFKTINDSLGHDVGDLLLKEVAARMANLAQKYSCSVARLGGDEFCMLSPSYDSKKLCLERANKFANELLKVLKETYYIDEHHLYISASIGVSIINDPEMKASTFIKEADIAMYEAKNQGRDGVILFNDDLSVRVERKLEIEKLLHFALEKNEISLMYQPQIDANDKIIGCEVLVRWNSIELGSVGPDEFIPIAEDTGLIIELGSYILEEAIKTLSEWEAKGIELEQMSINISMRQLFHTGFIDEVTQICSSHLDKSQASKVMFEITETSVAEDVGQLIDNMNLLKECGIRFSMDDFGTGYSSLSYLRQIPINELKIDKSFIDELG
ncbi:MAG: diguanylate cyclase, partial [Epsilonproteobacteria bacterium]